MVSYKNHALRLGKTRSDLGETRSDIKKTRSDLVDAKSDLVALGREMGGD